MLCPKIDIPVTGAGTACTLSDVRILAVRAPMTRAVLNKLVAHKSVSVAAFKAFAARREVFTIHGYVSDPLYILKQQLRAKAHGHASMY